MSSIDFKSDVARIRGDGPSGSGTRHFVRQRATGIANILLFLLLIIIGLKAAGQDYLGARLFFGELWVAITLGIGAISVSVHMALGMQMVIEDYLSPSLCRFFALLANWIYCILVGAITFYAALALGLGN